MSPSTQETLARYTQLRAISRTFNSAIARTLSAQARAASARQLGLRQRGAILIESEDDHHLLGDVALHDYFPDGRRNAVERYAARAEGLEEDERLVLEAMCRSHFTVVELGDVVPGLGAWARDLLFGAPDERFILADLGLGSGGEEIAGVPLALRLRTFESFAMSSGVSRQVDDDIAELLSGSVASTLRGSGPPARWSSQERASLARFLLRLTDADPDEAREMVVSYASSLAAVTAATARPRSRS